jgi:hypothetical protein
MMRPAVLIFVAITTARFLSSQSAVTVTDHVVWEHDFPNLGVSVTGAAVADRAGDLWAVSHYQRSNRLICIRPNGEMAVNVEVSKEIQPGDAAEAPFFSLAVSPAGLVVLVARYSHSVGRAVYFDGAALAVVNSDGTLGPVKKVASSGPEYKEFIALSDDHFLLMGDQSPMVVVRLSSAGEAAWRRTFPENWVLPSGASLDDGSACIVSPDYRRAILHLMWIDKSGTVRHQEQIAARRSQAASSSGSCTILYDQEPQLRRGAFSLTSFDRSFKRIWTTPVATSAPQGGVYGLAAISDGYVVTIALQDGVFLAKYGLSGQLSWAATDTSRKYADLIVPAGDSFYLIGAGPKDHYSFHVIRAI